MGAAAAQVDRGEACERSAKRRSSLFSGEAAEVRGLLEIFCKLSTKRHKTSDKPADLFVGGERGNISPGKSFARSKNLSLSLLPPTSTSSLHYFTMSSLAAFGSKTVARGVGRFTDLVLEKGSGAYITTDTGRQMFDFTSGIGVTNLGTLLLLSCAPVQL